MQSVILKIFAKVHYEHGGSILLSEFSKECGRYGLHFRQEKLMEILTKNTSIYPLNGEDNPTIFDSEYPNRYRTLTKEEIKEENIKSSIDNVISNLISNNFKILKDKVDIWSLQLAIRNNSGLCLSYDQMIYFLYKNNYDLILTDSKLIITGKKECVKKILNSLITDKYITYETVKNISLELDMDEFEVVSNMINNGYQFELKNNKSKEEIEKRIDQEIREYIKGETISREKLLEFCTDKELLSIGNKKGFEKLIEKYFLIDKEILEISNICEKFNIKNYKQIDVIRKQFEEKFNPILVIKTIHDNSRI